MNERIPELVIDRKKYVLITRKEYEYMQKKASRKMRPEKLLSVTEACALSKRLIHQWAKEK